MKKCMKAVGLAAGVLLGVAVAGCGGGGDAPNSQAVRDAALLVEGRVAPQVAIERQYVKYRSAAAAPVPSRITLDALDMHKAAESLAGSGPQLVGEARAVPGAATAALTLQRLQWERMAAGGYVAALSIAARDARGLRMGVHVLTLPNAAVLRVYSQDRSQVMLELTGEEVLALVHRNIQVDGDSMQARTWWTPDMGTDEATLEIELPAGVSMTAVQIAVPVVSHIFAELEHEAFPGVQEKINESGSCNVDALCDATLSPERDAVARMRYVRDGKSYLCTGTLLNDKQSSRTPYFLSANHCISTQTSASSLQTDWFYQSAGCQSRMLSNTTRSLSQGATLLYASTNSDVSFMRLNDTVPGGVYFAGWEAAPTAMAVGTAVTGLHHPAGDMLMISKGQVLGQTSCTPGTDGRFSCTGTSGNYDRVRWSSGTTQGGSSGSALFNSAGRVVGTLYGGSSSCTSSAGVDYYGRFYESFQSIKGWLAAGSNPEPTPEPTPTTSPLDSMVRILRRL